MISTWKVALLLFFSGASALVFQTVWLRQFRLIFGASTFATGAVLAIFMAGLGAGSALLGKQADAKERPLAWYAKLELFIAASAALSAPLLWLVAKIYFASGGSPALGLVGSTLLRLALATVVLAPATFLMGGTLPAASRAVAGDAGRRPVAVLYGVNTLGAVAGTVTSTFFLLESIGNRATLFAAVVVNLGVALAALAMSRTQPTAGEERVEVRPGIASGAKFDGNLAVPRRTAVYAAAAVVGFAFLLMELVWYRMLSPILGGSTYMFGLVLAVALVGMGMGGAAYALRGDHRPTLEGFALTSGLEALAIALPFALGDRIALFAHVLRNLGLLGFDGHIVAWTLITSIVILPAAFISGVQFPLLIALLGRGKESVGRHIGGAYAWNTAGAIAGSLAGGFGLLPLLSAPTTWRMVVVLLTFLAVGAALLAARERRVEGRGSTRVLLPTVSTLGAAILAVVCIAADGPSAVWRHSGIGAARAPRIQSRNELRNWMYDTRRDLLWDRDGRESSVGVLLPNDLAFIVNGKSDGAARGDAETQVMLGMIPATLHPAPRRALVVGLGTGESAGWLAAIPSMERVDVVELEPVVLDVARLCGPVNANAMSNPRLHISIGDAREVLLTSDQKWDVIASEPSNPYRAGIASLLTREFYEAVRNRLAPGGFLAQWVQAYSIHPGTMQTIYATLGSSFPHVQTWWTSSGDLVLVASVTPIVVDAGMLERRLQTEPYRSAVFNVWRIAGAEAFLARMFANENFARMAASGAGEINTDDRTVIEFGFARSLDESVSSLHRRIAEDAAGAKNDRPVSMRGDLDWDLVRRNRPWRSDPQQPVNVGELSISALELARRGSADAETHAGVVRRRQPIEADVILASLRMAQKRHDEAATLVTRALIAYRGDPWPQAQVMKVAIELAIEIARTSPDRARAMFAALSQPFSVYQRESSRKIARIVIAPLFAACGAPAIEALHAIEPNPVWSLEHLTIRANCYAIANDPLAHEAWRDLDLLKAAESTSLMPARR